MITVIGLTLLLFSLGEIVDQYHDRPPPPEEFRMVAALWFLFAGWWLFFKV